LRRAAGRCGIGCDGTKFAVSEKRVMELEEITRLGGRWRKRKP
jgi:hypothetical protein